MIESAAAREVAAPERRPAVAQSISYRVSLNGSNWQWVVQSAGKVIDFGVATNNVEARAEAMEAAISYIDNLAKDYERPDSQE